MYLELTWKVKVSVAICTADSQGIPCDRSEMANGASAKYKTTGDGTLHRKVSSGRSVWQSEAISGMGENGLAREVCSTLPPKGQTCPGGGS